MQMKIYPIGKTGILTTSHAASSYDLPVLIIDGDVYGPGDIKIKCWDVRPIEPLNQDNVQILTRYWSQLPGILLCLRCGNTWFARSLNRPGQCPDCGSRVWDRPRSGNEPGRKPKRGIDDNV